MPSASLKINSMQISEAQDSGVWSHNSKERNLQSWKLLTVQHAGLMRYVWEGCHFGMLSTFCLLSGSSDSKPAFQPNTQIKAAHLFLQMLCVNARGHCSFQNLKSWEKPSTLNLSHSASSHFIRIRGDKNQTGNKQLWREVRGRQENPQTAYKRPSQVQPEHRSTFSKHSSCRALSLLPGPLPTAQSTSRFCPRAWTASSQDINLPGNGCRPSPEGLSVSTICCSSPLTRGRTHPKNSILSQITQTGWFCRGEPSMQPPAGQALVSAQSSAPCMHDATLHAQDYNYSNCIICVSLLFESQRNTVKKKSNKSTWESGQMTKLHFLSQQVRPNHETCCLWFIPNRSSQDKQQNKTGKMALPGHKNR